MEFIWDNIFIFWFGTGFLVTSIANISMPDMFILGDSDFEEGEYSYNDDQLEIQVKSIREAIVNNTRKIKEAVSLSSDHATVTCNNNGFYE
jgi:hypothetical protein